MSYSAQHERMLHGDKLIYILSYGKMTRVGSSPREGHANFVIRCEYGDWSGFRTLQECEKQFPELESKGRPNGYYTVVER